MSSLRAKLLGGDEPRPKVGGGKRRARKKKPAGERASNKRRQMTCTGLDEQKIWNVHFGKGANAEGAESTETTQRAGVGSENHNPSLCALRPGLPLRSELSSISLEETMDLSDRAHDTRDPYTHFLVNADELNGEARPRVYPSCYMVGGGVSGGRRVSFETAEDELEGRRRRLASMGLEVHGVGSVSQMAALAARKLGRKRLKGILEQETVQEDWVSGEVKGERE